MTVIGYVVLTKQPDGSWRDDWDGEVHVTRLAADESLTEARATVGESAMLAALVPAEGAEKDGDVSG